MDKAKMTFRFNNGNRNEEAKLTHSNPNPESETPYVSYEPAWDARWMEEANEEKSTKDNQSLIVRREEMFDTQSLNSYTSDFGAWNNNPYDPETKKVEELIRNSGRKDGETGYYARDNGENGVLIPWYEQDQNYGFTRVSKTSWLKVTASVAGAIATGVGCGFLVLSLFTGTPDWLKFGGSETPSQQVSAPSTTTTTTTKPGTTSTLPADKAVTAGSTSTIGTVAVTIPARTYSMLQIGAFGSQAGAEAAQAELKKKGIPTTVEAADQYIVYAGLALKKEDATAMAQSLKGKADTYVKAVERKEITRFKWNGKSPETVTSYFTQGDKLLQSIQGLTALHMKETTPTALDKTSMTSVKSTLAAWVALQPAVQEGASEEMKVQLKKMDSAMNLAVKALDDYNAKPSADQLWNAQAALSQYVIAEKVVLK